MQLGAKAVLKALEFVAVRGDEEFSQGPALEVVPKRKRVAERVVATQDHKVQRQQSDGARLWYAMVRR